MWGDDMVGDGSDCYVMMLIAGVVNGIWLMVIFLVVVLLLLLLVVMVVVGMVVVM